MSDELVSQLREKEKDAIAVLKDNYESRMRYCIQSIVPDLHDQEEVLNDIWLRTWEKIEQYDVLKGSFHTWITAIARSCAINYLRKKNVGYVVLEEVKISVVEDPTIKMDLQAAINQLSKQEQRLYYRKYYYCQSHQLIAAEMGLTERAVDSKIYRLKKKLIFLLGVNDNE